MLVLYAHTSTCGELTVRDFRYLDVWHKAHAFTLRIYQCSESFPKNETFGLAATLRRSAAQFTMKIAEACGHDTPADYAEGLRRARAIGMEVEYQLLLLRDLHFMKSEDYDVLQAQVIEVRKMLSGLMKTASV
jgi:four helix bundle protein